jgi:hypothetical protein
MATTFRIKLETLLNKTIEITTLAGEAGVKGELLEVGEDFIVINPATAWDDAVVCLIPYTAIDSIDVAMPRDMS